MQIPMMRRGNFIQGSGGGLNFYVVGGTTQPTNPEENTIWVNTETEITGWSFSAAEPENPFAGMVYFETSTRSTVHLDAINEEHQTLMVYPAVARQYIDGEWVDVPAIIYQDGQWMEWDTYLIGQGVDAEALMGTWKHQFTSSSNTSVTYQSDGTVRFYRAASSASQAMYSGNKFDFSLYRTLRITASKVTSGMIENFGVRLLNSSDYPTHSVTISSAGTYNLDISTIEGEYELIAYMRYTGTDVTISELALIP